MGEVGIGILVGVLCVGLVVLRFVARRVAFNAGSAARERTIARTGKDPADNGFNRWAQRSPVGVKVLTVVFLLLGVLFGLWRTIT
jgi:hypothetical protein